MWYTDIVRQRDKYNTVADELIKDIDFIQTELNREIVSVHETIVSSIPNLSNQGFIIISKDKENEKII